MSVSRLPSGRYRAQIHSTVLGRNISVPQILSDGRTSYATREEAEEARTLARQILIAHTPHGADPLGPFITMQSAASWAGMDQQLLEELVVERGLPTIRVGAWKVCERALGRILGLPTPGPRERALQRARPITKPSTMGLRRGTTHWLYWLYDIHGELLYVGITNSGVKRLEQHGADKTWWAKVSRVDVEHFETRADAETAEREAIRLHHPAYNIVLRPKPRAT